MFKGTLRKKYEEDKNVAILEYLQDKIDKLNFQISREDISSYRKGMELEVKILKDIRKRMVQPNAGK